MYIHKILNHRIDHPGTKILNHRIDHPGTKIQIQIKITILSQ